MFVASCAPSPEASPPPVVEIREALEFTPAALLPASREGYRGVRVEGDRLVFRWQGPAPLWVGAVVSGVGDGDVLYLREIVSLHGDREGAYVAMTRPADLTDLLRRGEFVIRSTQDESGAAGQRVSALLQPTVEFERFGCGLGGSTRAFARPVLRPSVSIREMHMRIAPASAARCAVALGSPLASVIAGGCRGVVQRFAFAVDGTLDLGVTLSSETRGSVSCSFSLLPRGVASSARLGPVIPVAGVPVRFSLTPDVTVNLELSRTDTREVTLGRRVQFGAAMRYSSERGWTSEVTPPRVTPLPSAGDSTEVEGAVGVSVNAKFSADIALLVGPYLQVSPGFEYRRAVNSACEEEVTFGPSLGLSFGGAIRGLGLSVNLAEHTFPFDRTPSRRVIPSCDVASDAGASIDSAVLAPRDAAAMADGRVDAPARDAAVEGLDGSAAGDAPAPDRVIPVDAPAPDRVAPQCTRDESRPCERCGTQTRACVGGVWRAWSACAGQGACEPGSTRQCAGSMERITCSSQCRWPDCAPYCGDGLCGSGESCASCAPDCQCATGSVCVGGVCQGCGGVDQACCEGNRCNPSRTTCYVGTCRRCGASSEPCCTEGAACDTGAVCERAGTGRCQVQSSNTLWSTDFESVVIPRTTGGIRLSNGVEISDQGGPRIGSGPVAGPSSSRALGIYGVGSWQSAQSALVTLPVALAAGRSASLSLWVRGSNDGPGDARIVVRRGMCPEITRTVRRSLGWHLLDFTLDDCGQPGTGVLIQVGEYFEFPSDSAGLSIDDVTVRYL